MAKERIDFLHLCYQSTRRLTNPFSPIRRLMPYELMLRLPGSEIPSNRAFRMTSRARCVTRSQTACMWPRKVPQTCIMHAVLKKFLTLTNRNDPCHIRSVHAERSSIPPYPTTTNAPQFNGCLKSSSPVSKSSKNLFQFGSPPLHKRF
jgi:hypothetical protein